MQLRKFKHFFILFTTLIVGMCSIIYELLISTVSSYFLGDSVRQFSLIIGFYMAFMGLGSWLSRWIKKDHLSYFIFVELLLGIIGAFAVPMCYLYFSYADFNGYNIFILFLVSAIGTITGLEIPLITHILNDKFPVKDGLSDVLTLDYLGALVATLLFPFILIPFMGVYKSSLLFGFINIFIGVLNFIIFRDDINLKRFKKLIFNIISFASLAIIALAFLRADEFVSRWNRNLFKFPVVYEKSSPYQNIILTDNDEEFRLYLNGAIQFSSRDEYRYHEALVHIPAQAISALKSVLILGGGEGLAAREVLKYPEVENIDLVDLDEAVTKISSTFEKFRVLNENALLNEKLHIYHEDAMRWLMENEKQYDLIIIDLPDPSNEAIAKLYSVPFYNLIYSHLSERGVFCTQATGPDLSPKAFWSIEKTISEAGFNTPMPYQINVPSFGNWGFIMAGKSILAPKIYRTDISLKFVNAELIDHVFYFPEDVVKYKAEAEVNQLDKPIILQYYLDHWRELNAVDRK